MRSISRSEAIWRTRLLTAEIEMGLAELRCRGVGNVEHGYLEEKSFAAGEAAKQWSAKDTEQGALRAEENDLG